MYPWENIVYNFQTSEGEKVEWEINLKEGKKIEKSKPRWLGTNWKQKIR